MNAEHGELVIYETSDGKTLLEVQLEKENVWLTQTQIVELLQRDQPVISRHINKLVTDFGKTGLKKEWISTTII